MTRTARGTNMVDYVLNSRFGHDCTRHDGHNQPFRVRLTGYVFTVRCVGYKKTILNCRHCRHSWHQQKRFCYWRAGEDEEGNVHLLRKLRQIPVRKDDLRKNISIQHHQWRGWVFWYPWQLITMAASNINYKTKKNHYYLMNFLSWLKNLKLDECRKSSFFIWYMHFAATERPHQSPPPPATPVSTMSLQD